MYLAVSLTIYCREKEVILGWPPLLARACEYKSRRALKRLRVQQHNNCVRGVRLPLRDRQRAIDYAIAAAAAARIL